MERKIGEIFEYNGEWYQVIKASIDNHSCNGCQGCKGVSGPRIFGGECNGNARKDGKFVIFKKLEKIGEPYQYINGIYQEYKVETYPIISSEYYISTIKGFAVKIKQNKEDMEEKKLNLKPFDIQKAREGKPVCTRDGRKARIICFDKKGCRPIVALIENSEGIECVAYYNEKDIDLMMLPEKKEGWVNIYQLNTCYDTMEEAEASIDKDYEHEYVRTVKISWEE